MDKKLIPSIVVILIITGLVAVIFFGSKKKQVNVSKTYEVSKIQDKNTIVFFYGNTCPHCQETEKWMEKNEIEKKLKLVKKEVYENQENAQELTRAASNCGLKTDSIGVPFLYAKGKCLIGTPDIISYLSKKAGIKEATDSAKKE